MNKITKYRELRNMSKTELSIQSGLSRQSIHNMEKDITCCTIKTLILVANALRVDVKDLM